MTDTANKVRFGLSDVAIAPITAEGYGAPVPVPGAVSLTTDPDGSSEKFYADNGAYYVVVTNNGYTGELNMALVQMCIRDRPHRARPGDGHTRLRRVRERGGRDGGVAAGEALPHDAGRMGRGGQGRPARAPAERRHGRHADRARDEEGARGGLLHLLSLIHI